MAVYSFESRQLLETDISKAWDFFSDPRNLSRITPPALDFKILGELPAVIHPGLMIEYRVRPLLGIPARWLTEITHVKAGEFFVDEQRIGPYRIWHHEHHFQALPDGRTEMRDRVTYVLPFGLLGDLVHPVLVRPKLEEIFRYRTTAVKALFGGT